MLCLEENLLKFNSSSYILWCTTSPGPECLGSLELSNTNSRYHLSILDITGKVVFSKSAVANKEVLDLSFLSRGIYIIRLQDDRSFIAQRMVIE